MLSLSILHHLREPLKELKYVRLLSKYFYFLSGFSIKQVGDFAEQKHLTLKARNVLLSGKFKQCYKHCRRRLFHASLKLCILHAFLVLNGYEQKCLRAQKFTSKGLNVRARAIKENLFECLFAKFC